MHRNFVDSYFLLVAFVAHDTSLVRKTCSRGATVRLPPGAGAARRYQVAGTGCGLVVRAVGTAGGPVVRTVATAGGLAVFEPAPAQSHNRCHNHGGRANGRLRLAMARTCSATNFG